MPEEDNVVAGPGKCFRQAPRDLRVVRPDDRIGPVGRNVVREQPTVVGMVIDDEKFEQKA